MKINKLHIALLSASLAFTGPFAWAETDLLPVVPTSQSKKVQVSQEPNIPPVPANVMSNGVPRPIGSNTKTATTINTTAESRLIMQSGVNQIVPIAVGHLNRLVTPFSNPVVLTGSPATYQVEQNVVYIGTSVEEPVTVFINEKDDQVRSFSLTLVPQRIPPRELFLSFSDGFQMVGNYTNRNAEKWETSQPYVDTIKSLFRHLALGEVPQGYSISGMSPNVPTPNCQMPGLSFDFSRGQLLMGHSLSVVVGVAHNISGAPIEFKEAACGNWDVAAVAAWPHNMLNPNEKTEVYIARKVQKSTGNVTKRPSLVN